MIMFGGLDSLAEELYFGPCQHLNERGIALLVVDGPGQGASLRLNHIYTRYDFNVAGTAVLGLVTGKPATGSCRYSNALVLWRSPWAVIWRQDVQPLNPALKFA